MRTFNVIKPENSNSIIAELNAGVLTSTFKDKAGVQKADLYEYTKGCCYVGPKEVVAHGTCAPILATFVETINVMF